jgi:acyl carrier protein
MTQGTDSEPQVALGRDTVAPRIREFIVENFLLGDDDGFDNAASLLDSGVVDSTGVMEVVNFLEDSFAISIDDEELVADNLDSVDCLARFVERKGREAAVDAPGERAS